MSFQSTLQMYNDAREAFYAETIAMGGGSFIPPGRLPGEVDLEQLWATYSPLQQMNISAVCRAGSGAGTATVCVEHELLGSMFALGCSPTQLLAGLTMADQEGLVLDLPDNLTD